MTGTVFYVFMLYAWFLVGLNNTFIKTWNSLLFQESLYYICHLQLCLPNFPLVLEYSLSFHALDQSQFYLRVTYDVGILFDPADGGDMFSQNPLPTALQPRRL